jgi:hypothetical protein
MWNEGIDDGAWRLGEFLRASLAFAPDNGKTELLLI